MGPIFFSGIVSKFANCYPARNIFDQTMITSDCDGEENRLAVECIGFKYSRCCSRRVP